MNHVVLMKVVDCIEDLADGLRRILLRELALLTDSVEQLATGGQLSYNIVLILRKDTS